MWSLKKSEAYLGLAFLLICIIAKMDWAAAAIEEPPIPRPEKDPFPKRGKVGPNRSAIWRTTFMPPVCKRKSKAMDMMTVDYVGYFPSGVKFDSTYDRKEPMEYQMSMGKIIKGCEEATMNMCVGERRHMLIPPELAYGFEDYNGIPGGSTLIFDQVLRKLEDGPDPMAEMGLVRNPDGSWPMFK